MKSKKKKNTKKEESSNNQGLPVVILIVVGAVGYFAYNKINENAQKAGIEEAQTTNVKKKRNPEPEPVEYPESSPYGANGGVKEEREEVVEESPQEAQEDNNEQVVQAEITKKVEERKREQESVRNNMKSLLQMEIDLPRNLHYAELDLDEGIAGIRGTGTGDIRDFSILGTKKKVSAQMATAFLNENNSGVPTSKGVRFKGKSKIKVEAPPGKGISKIEIIDSSNPNVKAALISRSDGKGSYLFVLRGQSGFFNNNEGFLDNMLKNFQAK